MTVWGRLSTLDVWRCSLAHGIPAVRFGGRITHDADHVVERHLTF
jgi:hypothetical protein